MSKIELNTDRLFLRPLTIDDAVSLFDYRSDALANKYQGWIPAKIEEVHDFLKNNMATEFNSVNTWYQLAIIRKEDQVLVGDIGLHFTGQKNEQVEIGFTLNKKHQGNGYAYESLETVIEYLFRVLDKHRITASVDPRNINSLKLLEKLGFRKEAHFKKSFLFNDEWVDDVIFALLKEEWI